MGSAAIFTTGAPNSGVSVEINVSYLDAAYADVGTSSFCLDLLLFVSVNELVSFRLCPITLLFLMLVRSFLLSSSFCVLCLIMNWVLFMITLLHSFKMCKAHLRRVK